MSNFNSSDPTMDARLKALLESLRETPPREPQAAARTRARFIQELNTLFPDEEASPSKRITGRSPIHPNRKENILMSLKQRFALTVLTLIALAAIVLFGGAGVTVYAAQNALPGDALYPVKTRLEQTRIALTGDPALRTQLYLSFAERRLNEMALLIQEGRVDQMDQVAKEFNLQIQRAIDAFGIASTNDPAQAESLASQIATTLLRYAQTLNSLLASAPEEVRPTIQQAIKTSTLALGLGLEEGEEVEVVGIVEAITANSVTINGQTFTITNQSEIKNQVQVGAMVKVHATADADGTLRVREMEQVQTQEQHQEREQHQAGQNENGNANENANSNTNINANDNDDDDNANGNANGNTNMNANDDDDNGNGNTNTNINGNDNDDDDESGNANSNTNMNANDDDDDNANGNSNANINSNANDDDNNTNGNANSNTNINANENSDDNANGNSNGNSNSHDNNNNESGNQNDDDDHNENDKGNGNENGYIPLFLLVI